MMTTAQKTLLYLNREYNGSWDRMFKAIQNKEYPTDKIDDVSQNHQFVCITDPSYPTKLRQSFKPPFVLFYEGDLSLLNKNNIMCICGCDKGSNGLSKLITDLSNTHIVINGDDSVIEREALQLVMKNNQPLILVLNESIDESDLDDEVFLYAVAHGLVITEYGFTSPDIDETQLAKTRIIGFLSDSMLVTSSNKKNTRLCLLIDEALSAGKDLFVLPEPPFKEPYSLNNELIQNGAILTQRREDIF